MAGRESDGHDRKYVHSFPSLSKIGSFLWLLLFSLFFSVPALILFLNNALSSFFSTHFYPWTFLCCCCRAVFAFAYDFNRDLSTWQVGKVTTMREGTYTLFFFCPHGREHGTDSFFEQCSLLFFFEPIFILGLFFVAVVQCFILLVPSMVISPNGRSGK